MRTKFGSDYSALIREWMARPQAQLSCVRYGRQRLFPLYSEGGILYSYGAHYPLARYLITPTGERALVVNPVRYTRPTDRQRRILLDHVPAGTTVLYAVPLAAAPGYRHSGTLAFYHYLYTRPARRDRLAWASVHEDRLVDLVRYGLLEAGEVSALGMAVDRVYRLADSMMLEMV